MKKFSIIILFILTIVACTKPNFIVKNKGFDILFNEYHNNIITNTHLSLNESLTQVPFNELNTTHEEYFVYHLFNNHKDYYDYLYNNSLIKNVYSFIGNDYVIINNDK